MLGKLNKWFTGSKPEISRQQSMQGIPVIAKGVTSLEGPDGERMLFIPRQQTFPSVVRFFGGPTEVPPARLLLDELGNSVWQKIDGTRDMGAIIRLFAEERGLHRREAEAGVVQFINLLMRRRIVSVAFES